jgi:quinol monooxygenase YgiN
MSQISVIAKIPCKPGARADVIDGLRTMLEHVESEEGTLRYVLHQDANDDDLLWVYEVYADQAGLDAHSKSDAMKSLGRAIGAHMAGAPELTFMTPVGGKGA